MNLCKFKIVEACPLCDETAANEYPTAPSNLYSEKLAGLLDMSEADLLAVVNNVQCRACGLIYKRRWFPSDILRTLFSRCLPVHPKGWDVVSGRFSVDNFQHEVSEYRQAIERGEGSEIARLHRALKSIIDSIPERGDAERLDHMRAAIEAGDINKLLGQRDWLADRMDKPIPYTRFAGFSSPEIWQYLDQRVGPIRSYGEVGCPLWGQLKHAAASNVAATFVKREETNYWGSGCRREGLGCLDALMQGNGIEIRHWNENWTDTLDLLGLFQYLDHLEQPDHFIAEATTRADSIAIILDGVGQPPAVQHFTGWPEASIQKLAHRHGFQVHSDFSAIHESGNHLYLLARNRTSAAA